MTSQPITTPLEILIVEDDPALASLAQTAVSVFVGARIHVAHTARDAREFIEQHAIDLAVIDIGLPDGSGIDVLRVLKAGSGLATSKTPVCVMHTVFDTDDMLFAALGAGADGYLLKGESSGMMASRLRAAMRGEPAISPAIARRVLDLVRASAPATSPPPGADHASSAGLTAGELRVLRLIAQGATVAEVASTLGRSVNTVKSQVKRVYARLDVHSRVAAAEKARRLGLLLDSE
ncbi:response regulator transcription factor [Gemmatimonas sp.]|uniref:response regulator transcription factor n=1 Tax=Gemmatimonas sp. TaxID=1962908 RepID=UPI00286BC3E7|nr:response regulator transcription factor [Gemmatimonas sp.]